METTTTTKTIEGSTGDDFQWTPSAIAQSIALFLLAGVAEIVGGWMIWYAQCRIFISLALIVSIDLERN